MIGISQREASIPKGEYQPIIWQNFPENCMETKKVGLGACVLHKKCKLTI